MSLRGTLLAPVLATAVGAACTSPASNGAATAVQDQDEPPTDYPVRIKITTNDQSFTAVLEDSETARNFASLLPIEVTLDDYNRTEKIADLPRRLSTAGAPEGADPTVGDIAYYAPWGNLAIYSRDFAYSRGLVRLGRLESDATTLADIGPGKARIEIIPED